MRTHALSDFRSYWLPSFSSLNGPANLAYLVQQMELLGVRPSQVRLFPYFGHGAFREVLSYGEYHQDERLSRASRSAAAPADDIRVHLLVNVRPDNRLHAFLPLLCVGLLPDSDCSQPQAWVDSKRLWQARYRQRWESMRQSPVAGGSEALAASSDAPSTAEQFFESWIEQLLNRFPELNTDSDAPYELRAPSARTVLQHTPLPPESALEGFEWDLWRSQTRTIRELMHWFLTNAFLLIGCIDLLAGKEYRYFVHESLPAPSKDAPAHSSRRSVGIPINSQVTERTLCQWLHAVPHYLIEPLETEPNVRESSASASSPAPTPPRWVKRPSFGRAAETPQQDAAQGAQAKPLTPEHPDIPALVEVLRKRATEKGADLEIAEVLSLIRRYLPYYMPLFPTQTRVIGGTQLLTLMIRHLRGCWADGFIGIEPSELALFEPSEREVLEGLVVLRRVVADPFRLFQLAVRLTLGSDVGVDFVPYQPIVCLLGSCMAALSKTLVISERPRIHNPSVVVTLPLDRTQQPESAQYVQRKLETLRRLFIPAHYALTVRWQVDWARLGETAHLSSAEGAKAGASTSKLEHIPTTAARRV